MPAWLLMLASGLLALDCIAWLRVEQRQRLVARDDRIVDQLAAGGLPAFPDRAEKTLAAWRDEVRR